MFGKILKQILEQRNISHYRLSKLSGVSESTINTMIRGEINYPSFENAIKIADALDISLDEFRNGDKNE